MLLAGFLPLSRATAAGPDMDSEVRNVVATYLAPEATADHPGGLAVAVAAFGLSCVLSVIYLAQQRLLHKHQVASVLWRLPPLDLLDRMSQSSVLVGLISIAIGTVLGFVWVDRLTGAVWHYDPKYAVTLLVLAAYVIYLRLARNPGWRGSRASRLCIFNFAIVIFSFTVVNLFFSQSHRYF